MCQKEIFEVLTRNNVLNGRYVCDCCGKSIIKNKVTLREALEDVKIKSPNGVFSGHFDSSFCRDDANNLIHNFNLHLSDIHVETHFGLATFEIERESNQKQGKQIIEILYTLLDLAEELGVVIIFAMGDADKRHFDVFESIVWKVPIILDSLHMPNSVRSRIIKGHAFYLGKDKFEFDKSLFEKKQAASMSGDTTTGINTNNQFFNTLTAKKNAKLLGYDSEKENKLIRFLNFMAYTIKFYEKGPASEEDLRALRGKYFPLVCVFVCQMNYF